MSSQPLHHGDDVDQNVGSHADRAEFVSNNFDGWSSTHFDVYESSVNLVEQVGQSQKYHNFDDVGGVSFGAVEAKRGSEEYGQGSDFDDGDLLHNLQQEQSKTRTSDNRNEQHECNSKVGDFNFCNGIREDFDPRQSTYAGDSYHYPTHHPSKIPRNHGVESDLPSVERRRRRRNKRTNSYASPSSLYGHLDSDENDFSRGNNRMERVNWGLVVLVVFLIIFTVQKDEIVRDIRQYNRARSINSQFNISLWGKIQQIPRMSYIFVTYVLLSPLFGLVQTMISLLHQCNLMISNPFEAPQLISHIFWVGFENAGLVLNQMQLGMRTLFSPVIRILGFDLLMGTDNPFGHGENFEYIDDDSHSGMGSTANSGDYRQGMNFPFSVGIRGVPELERVDSCNISKHGSTDENNCEKAGPERSIENNNNPNGNAVSNDNHKFESPLETSDGNANFVEGTNKVECNAFNGHDARYDTESLNPAFLAEEEYPQGWLMYHPKHGVITREKLIELEGH